MQIGNISNISSSAGTGGGGYRGIADSKGDDQEEAKCLPEATA